MYFYFALFILLFPVKYIPSYACWQKWGENHLRLTKCKLICGGPQVLIIAVAATDSMLGLIKVDAWESDCYLPLDLLVA